MKILSVIPARGGSKGLPGKNKRLLLGKSLIYYSIDMARYFCSDEDICISTDDIEILDLVESYGLKVPFIRPDKLASDTATTNDVLIHALDYYKEIGKEYDVILLLQPTSPLRNKKQIQEAFSLFDEQCDMVVSVKKSHAASVLCHVNDAGWLTSTLTNAQRRQDVPEFFEYNGAIYIINVKSLREKGLSGFDKERMYIMPEVNSVDIDTLFDFDYCEFLLQRNPDILK